MRIQAALACLWCGTPFEPRRGGSQQRFCRAAHRVAFHRAARSSAERAVAGGALTIADLRKGGSEPCTLRRVGQSRLPLPGIGLADPTLSDALLAFRRMVLRLPISIEGIADLMRLGWIEPRDCRNPAAVAKAIIDLADAALGARLRPR